MLGSPLLLAARAAMALAMSMLIAVSSRGSDLRPSTLKKSQLLSSLMGVCASNNLEKMPFSPVHARSFMAAGGAFYMGRRVFFFARPDASSPRSTFDDGVKL